jgi:hypothetical protein
MSSATTFLKLQTDVGYHTPDKVSLICTVRLCGIQFLEFGAEQYGLSYTKLRLAPRNRLPPERRLALG